MKKILFLIGLISMMWGYTPKTNYFVGVDVGDLTISDRDNTETFVGVRLGGYFYDENQFIISNRFYLNIEKVLTDNTSFYINNLNLDWIWNQMPYVKPFVGISGGYLYYSYSTSNYSTGIYGLQTGALIYLGKKVEFEIGAKIDHPTQKTESWRDNLKKIYGAINFSF